jgi:hypothetical protein
MLLELFPLIASAMATCVALGVAYVGMTTAPRPRLIRTAGSGTEARCRPAEQRCRPQIDWSVVLTSNRGYLVLLTVYPLISG